MAKDFFTYPSLLLLVLLRACPAIQAEGGEGLNSLSAPPFWTAFTPDETTLSFCTVVKRKASKQARGSGGEIFSI